MNCEFKTSGAIKAVPTNMTCTCSANATDQVIEFGRDIFSSVDMKLAAHAESITITNCSGALRLTSEASETARGLIVTDGLSLSVEGLDSFELELAAGANSTLLRSLRLVDVGNAEITFGKDEAVVAPTEAAAEFTEEEIYFDGMIGASCLFLLTLVALVITLISVFCCSSRRYAEEKLSW